jgi:hypothetical protein
MLLNNYKIFGNALKSQTSIFRILQLKTTAIVDIASLYKIFRSMIYATEFFEPFTLEFSVGVVWLIFGK